MKEKKFIVTNCPACTKEKWLDENKQVVEGYLCSSTTIDDFECKDINNCLIKRIIKECKDYEKQCPTDCDYNATCGSCFLGGALELADNIERMLIIKDGN